MNGRITLAKRYKALLRVTQTALRKSSISELFDGLCASLKRVVAYDWAGLALYDPDDACLKVEGLHDARKNGPFEIGAKLQHASGAEWRAFERKVPTIRHDLTRNPGAPSDKTFRDGYRSLCAVPIVVRNRSIGVLILLGTRKNQFSPRHLQATKEMLNQVALAISLTVPRCSIHEGTRLVCPKCIGAAGGKKTVLKHRERLSGWGKSGGRGRKKPG